MTDETRMRKEDQAVNAEWLRPLWVRRRRRVLPLFQFRHSDFIRISGFVIRISPRGSAVHKAISAAMCAPRLQER